MTMNLSPRDLIAPLSCGDIDAGHSLPSWVYTDPEVWEAEKQAIFYHHWHYFGHESLLDEPGKYVTTSIQDQELFLTRDTSGVIRAFYNVCRHRGHPLVQGEGQKTRFACPYHAWTYDLTGSLIGAPGTRNSKSFSRADIRLAEVRVEKMLGFIFVNLDPDAPTLADYVGDLPNEIRSAVPDVEKMRPIQGGEYFNSKVRANWKIVIDNYQECYHCGPAHGTFPKLFDLGSMRQSFSKNYSCQVLRGTSTPENAPYPIDPATDMRDGHFWMLYPNTVIGSIPGTPGLYITRIDSLAPDHCVRFAHSYALDGASSEKRHAAAILGLGDRQRRRHRSV